LRWSAVLLQGSADDVREIEMTFQNSEGSKSNPNPAPKSVEFNIGGNIEKVLLSLGTTMLSTITQ
jgi:hypothetical protein